MTLREFRDLLLTVTDKVYHFEAQGDTSGEHIIWQETGGRRFPGDDGRVEVIQEVQIDLFTKDDFSELLDDLLAALEKTDIAFEEPVTTYEKETGFIRHIVECEVF